MTHKALTTLTVFMTVLLFLTIGSLIAAEAPETINMESRSSSASNRRGRKTAYELPLGSALRNSSGE